MAISSYDNAAATSITDDLKVFFGTIGDIKAIASAGKVVNRKWYLAWDTGEFFIGGGTKRLYRFGGSNNDMSEADVKSLIESYTGQQLTIIKSQIALLLKNFNDNTSDIANLRSDVEKAIESLNTDTKSYIEAQVKVVLDSASSITYSKSKIDSMLVDLLASMKSVSYTKTETDSLLSSQKTEVESFASNLSVWHKTGNEISTMKAAGLTKAICICTEKSTLASADEYLPGHIYSINKSVVTDITAGGTGGSSYIAPTITLLVGGKSSAQVLTGGSFAQATTFDYSVSNPENMATEYLILSQNSGSATNRVVLSSDLSVSDGSVSVVTSLSNLTPGAYLYTLVGTDTKNNEVTGTFTVFARSPIYYGHMQNAIIGDSSETAEQIAADAALIKTCPYMTGTSASGKYQFKSILDGEYIWFFVPSEIDFDPDGVYLSGFSAKFGTSYSEITVKLNNVSEKYRCYRSVSALQQTDSITLTVA